MVVRSERLKRFSLFSHLYDLPIPDLPINVLVSIILVMTVYCKNCCIYILPLLCSSLLTEEKLCFTFESPESGAITDAK